MAERYRRTLIIFANLTRISASPQERVVFIYGSGYIPLLTQCARDCGLCGLHPGNVAGRAGRATCR